MRSRPRSLAGPDLDAFRRHHDDMPAPLSSPVLSAVDGLPASGDPAVTFARLAEACVPLFADGCAVEICEGGRPPFRVTYPDGDATEPGSFAPRSEQSLHTPFRVPSRSGYPSYAGLLTHWWAGRTPTAADADVAGLMARQAIAMVDRERLMTAIGRAEDQAAEAALAAISGRTINLAVGVVMYQRALSPEDAELQLRRAATRSESSLYEMAVQVVRSGQLADPVSDPPTAGQESQRGKRLRSVAPPQA